MANKLHDGLTLNPADTLQDGSAEIPLSRLFSVKAGLSGVPGQLAFKLRRQRLKRMSAKKRFVLRDRGSEELLSELLEIIREKKKQTAVLAVLAPWHEDATLSKSEGYLRRIAEIDSRILFDFFCVYVYECPYHRPDRIVADRLSDTRIYIRYNADYSSQLRFAEAVIRECGVLYSHSVLRIIPNDAPEDRRRWLDIFSGDVRHILDVHGAVMEENALLGKESENVWVKRAEELYFNHIEHALVLTSAMRRYFEDRYECGKIIFTVTPVFSVDISGGPEEAYVKQGALSAVYSGGCQAWQNIELMQRAIRQGAQLAEYLLFVSEPEVFGDLWGDEPMPANVRVKTGTPDEVRTAYLRAHYGFILRDDNILNRVACPTKLMEYIRFGIVPVMKFAEIGDFMDLGLEYVPLEQFMDGALPPESERERMARTNLGIARRLEGEYESAADKIIGILTE